VVIENEEEIDGLDKVYEIVEQFLSLPENKKLASKYEFTSRYKLAN
jgi:hypothetical protein